MGLMFNYQILVYSNKVHKDNEIQVFININKRAKKRNYPKLEIGHNVRVPVLHKIHSGTKTVLVRKLKNVENINRGSYTVDGSLNPRKDLQIVKGNVLNAPTRR
jgi:hypothetical protein